MPLPVRPGILAATLGLLVAVWLAWYLYQTQTPPNPGAASEPTSSPVLDEPSDPAPDPDDGSSEARLPTQEREQPVDAGAPERPRSEEAFWDELTRLRAIDKAQALKYALLGEQWYGSVGRPAEARGAMIVSLLVDLNRMEEARSRTREFIEAYPNSNYRIMVQGLTGIHPRPSAPAPNRSAED
jgi:hypothetical protein